MAPTDGKLAMSASPTSPTSDNFARDIRGMVVSAHGCDRATPNCSTSTAIPSAPLRIGAGHCGSVWTVADASWVIKRADESKHRSLWKEYYLQNRILSHLNKSTAVTTKIQIPASFWFTSTNGCKPATSCARSGSRHFLPLSGICWLIASVQKKLAKVLKTVTPSALVGAEIAQRRQLEETLPSLFIERLVALQVETPSKHHHFPRGPYCARHNDEEA